MATKKEKTPQDVGKAFEDEMREFLMGLSRKHCACYHRLYDAHSAGGFMPAQPGDGLLLYQGVQHLLEFKSSAAHSTLSAGLSNLVKTQQAGLMKFWHRAGAVCHYIFLDQNTREVELWAGAPVFEARLTFRARLKPEGARMRFANPLLFQAYFESALRENPRFSAFGA